MATLRDIFPELQESKGLIFYLDADKLSLWFDDLARPTPRLKQLVARKESYTSIIVGGSTGISADLMWRTCMFLQLQGYNRDRIGLIPPHHEAVTVAARYVVTPVMMNAGNEYYRFEYAHKLLENIAQIGITPILTAYLLVEPAQSSSVGKVTRTNEISRREDGNLENHVDTANYQGGFQTLSLEAGSGANRPLTGRIVERCRCIYSGMITTGGGIKTPEQARELYAAGADVVIVGDALEKAQDPGALIDSLARAR